jgi:rhodanese-related sulfurtransferase
MIEEQPKMNLKTNITIIGTAFAVAFIGPVSAEGNRYELPRYYVSDISASDAYLAMAHNNSQQTVSPVLIDVRTLREYASGHPDDAYNVPFPNIIQAGDQDPVKMYWEIYDIVNGNLDTPIMLLCRTGFRSVLAGNILADPESDPRTANHGLAPFTNVHNIWDGFVGLYRYAFVNGVPDPTKVLDLNNDNEIDVDVADVYTQTKDANPDKDGWRNFVGLPWTTQVQLPLAYTRDTGLYSALNLTPVQAE